MHMLGFWGGRGLAVCRVGAVGEQVQPPEGVRLGLLLKRGGGRERRPWGQGVGAGVGGQGLGAGQRSGARGAEAALCCSWR